jgi:MYXO-CTERM domain-containing protein
MLASVVCMVGGFAAEARAASQLMDYFTATPIVGSLSSTAWGAAQVGPRDQSNGLEDKTLAKWVYWDGGIIKAPDGTYHMFASRWDQSNGHNGWMCCSYAIHATSKNLYGPYTDLGTFYTFDGGKGHNVTPFVMPDGQYGVSISGVRPGHVFTASSLDGPWTDKGDVQVSGGLCTQCNMKIMYRPDKQYMAIASDGRFALGPNVAGPYVTQGASFYSQISNLTDITKLEDPTVWYSGGKYHWLTNQWATRKAYHFTSTDGIKDWKVDQGYAYDPMSNFIRYTDGTVNHWAHIERPEVYMEDGHVVAFTFAAINVDKDQDLANDQNGSKVIVVPFDGVTFDFGGIPGSGTGGSSGGTGGSAAGGASGSGVDAGVGSNGGGPGSGGRSGSGGGGGAGGTTGPVGTAGASGGVTSAGGASGGLGGTSSSSGAGGSSGSTATGSGGRSGSGGMTETGRGGAGSGGAKVASTPAGSGSSGCSCAIQSEPRSSAGGLLLLVGLAAEFLSRRRRRSNERGWRRCRWRFPDRAGSSPVDNLPRP